MSTAELFAEWEVEVPTAECEDQPDSSDPKNAVVSAEAEMHEMLNAEIKRAENILELKDDWDGEGAAAYSKDTLERAVAFLSKHVQGLWDSFNVCAPIPVIGPGPDGSIDLSWKQKAWELLVNIPADRNAMAVFYGDNYGTQKIRGSIDPRNFNLGIATWLMN